MRFAAVAAVFLLVGCQGEDSRYDAAALRQARVVASTTRAWPAWATRPVSVGRPSERKLCEARTYHADPCIAVPTVHRVRKLDIHGEVFVWLERDGERWRVVDTDYVTRDLEVTVEASDGGSSIAPPWATGLP